MADMVELADSNGDASPGEKAADLKLKDVKQNGDTNVNGSCVDSAMDVDEAPVVTKKVVNNEIVSTDEAEDKDSQVENDKPAVKNGSVENSKEDTKDSVDENSKNEDSEMIENEQSENDPLATAQSEEAAGDEDTSKGADKSEESKDSEKKKEDGEDEAMEVDGEQKLNGSNASDEGGVKDEDGSEVDGEGTPKKNKKNAAPLNLTPRRSSRNVGKKLEEKEVELVEDESPKKKDDDDIQEVDVDPLADSKAKPLGTDIKTQAENLSTTMASINKVPPKKEPTLVIIDTNSILSGKGPIPVASSNVNKPPGLTMLPVQNKPNQNKSSSNKPAVPSQPPPILLPSLTDDMFVVEAPSFIVPYVYEKPPVKPLKEFVDDLDKTLKKEKEDKEKEKKKKLEEKNKDKDEKEKSDSDEKDKEEEGDKKEEDKEKDKESKDEKMDEDKKSSDDEDVDETKEDEKEKEEKKGSGSYFDNALGKFFMHIGINLVQEHVQNDLLKSQKRKREREGTKVSSDTLAAISSLTKTLEFSKENNDPYRFEMQKCEYCNFKTESKLVMAHHLETPHMKNYIYRCNFCPLEVRSPHDIMYHMEAEHNVRGRLEKAPAFHQCPSCLFEDNQKGKLTRHLISCAKKYRPDRNQEPPLDWEPPAKIPRVSRNRPNAMSPGNAIYNAAMSGLKSNTPSPVPGVSPKMPGMMALNNPAAAAMSQALMSRQRGRPVGATAAPGLLFRPTGPQNLMLPAGYSIQGGQIIQSKSGTGVQTSTVQQASKLVNQPSISITPLPRQGAPAAPAPTMPSHAKPGRPQPAGPGGKNTFVICEICDGYIKDLEQLRNHMQWIHKVKIHPKMIYNRPPLNCQKCQFRFFTDQGLERHLLGSHGLVTSSMQEAANKGKDGGRCPVCGRVYQWKLLNHVARDHNMSLKPAHLSYKCTVCTATFGMYRQFENHVYSAHSVAPRRPNADKKPQSTPSSSSSSSTDPMLKPLKINDEITIIPQPSRPSNSPSTNSNKVKITPVPSKK